MNYRFFRGNRLSNSSLPLSSRQLCGIFKPFRRIPNNFQVLGVEGTKNHENSRASLRGRAPPRLNSRGARARPRSDAREFACFFLFSNAFCFLVHGDFFGFPCEKKQKRWLAIIYFCFKSPPPTHKIKKTTKQHKKLKL